MNELLISNNDNSTLLTKFINLNKKKFKYYVTTIRGCTTIRRCTTIFYITRLDALLKGALPIQLFKGALLIEDIW